MLKYDIHNHTHYSPCSTLKPELLLKINKKAGMNGLAVTDHHTTKGALTVKKINKDKDFEVIIGEEVTTQYGDVLCLYLNKEITVRDFYEVTDEVKKQGGIAIIAHPFRASLNPKLKFRHPIEKIKNRVAGIECFNARMLPGSNGTAQKFAKQHDIAGTGGSDAHFWFDAAKAHTIFDGNLISALKKKQTSYAGTIRYGAIGGICSFVKKRISPAKK